MAAVTRLKLCAEAPRVKGEEAKWPGVVERILLTRRIHPGCASITSGGNQ